MARDFIGVKNDECYIPISGAAGDIFHYKDFICAMAASLKQFEPCSQSHPSQAPVIGDESFSSESPTSFDSIAPVTEIPVSQSPVADSSFDLSPMEKAATNVWGQRMFDYKTRSISISRRLTSIQTLITTQ